MKTSLILLSLLAAGTLSAQPSKIDRNLQTEIAAPSPDNRITFHPQESDEYHGRWFTCDGVLVETLVSPDHLELFNPFDHYVQPSPPDNLVSDERTGRVLGWNIFSIKF